MNFVLPKFFSTVKPESAKMLIPASPFFDAGMSGIIQTACFPGPFVERLSLLRSFSVENFFPPCWSLSKLYS